MITKGGCMKKYAIALVVLFIVACGHSDLAENAYKTADEWGNDTENISWKPAFLPAESGHIKEIHNLITNEIIGTYHYKETPFEEGAELKIMTRNTFQLQLQRLSSIPLPRWFITDKEVSKKKDIRVYQSEQWYIVDDFREKTVFFVKIPG